MKTKVFLSSVLCALWLLVLFGPKSWFSSEESRIMGVAFIDFLLLGIFSWCIFSWINERKRGLLTAASVFVLIIRVIGLGSLPRFPANIFLILALIDILLLGVFFWCAFSWIKDREKTPILMALALVLISHVALPPLEGATFYIVAMAPIILFFTTVLITIYRVLLKAQPSPSSEN